LSKLTHDLIVWQALARLESLSKADHARAPEAPPTLTHATDHLTPQQYQPRIPPAVHQANQRRYFHSSELLAVINLCLPVFEKLKEISHQSDV
jgi:hypothetical protein